MSWKKFLRKLISRKFWVGLGGAIGGFIAIFASSGVATKVSGAILAFGSIVGYILGEGLVDAAHKNDDEDKE